MKNLLPMRMSVRPPVLVLTHAKLGFVHIRQFLSCIQPLIDLIGHNVLQLVFLCESSSFMTNAPIITSHEVSSSQLRRGLFFEVPFKDRIMLTCTRFEIIMLNLYSTNLRSFHTDRLRLLSG